MAHFPQIFGGYGLGFPSGPFEQNYRCYSASFIDKPHLENGDKVIMPPSALDRLASLRIDYPMLFEIHNPATSRKSHCGVLEFVADEGMIIMPYWMMQNLLLQEGDIVRVKSATLPKGTYVKLQPHTRDFLDISNPKAVLETTLRSFSCLTVGDNIMVAYNNKRYYIDIVESKPGNAISIIETDCEVDFAPPLDYKEPEAPAPRAAASAAAAAPVAEPEEEEEPKLKPFTGVGRRLDGKPAICPPAQDKPAGVAKAPAKTQAAASQAPAPGQRAPGKLVFGSQNGPSKPVAAAAAAAAPNTKEPDSKEEPKEDSSPKFQAFTGRKYTLKG